MCMFCFFLLFLLPLTFSLIHSSEKKLSKYSVRLHTSVLDQSYFKIGKLSPERNNVRRSFLSSDEHASSEEEVEPGPATPHYNAHMLMELGARERHLKEIYVATQECPGLVDAIILFKVWAKQRGLDKVSCLRIMLDTLVFPLSKVLPSPLNFQKK